MCTGCTFIATLVLYLLGTNALAPDSCGIATTHWAATHERGKIRGDRITLTVGSDAGRRAPATTESLKDLASPTSGDLVFAPTAFAAAVAADGRRRADVVRVRSSQRAAARTTWQRVHASGCFGTQVVEVIELGQELVRPTKDLHATSAEEGGEGRGAFWCADRRQVGTVQVRAAARVEHGDEGCACGLAECVLVSLLARVDDRLERCPFPSRCAGGVCCTSRPGSHARGADCIGVGD